MNSQAFINRPIPTAVRSILRGSGQVMFQCNAWTGLLFLCGIFWGAYENHLPQVGWGALVGLVASMLAGYLSPDSRSDGKQGLWGFNGILVGCAFPTFLANTWLMWVTLILCAMVTTWVRNGFNNVMAPWKVNSLTFPFVFMTWIFLYAARMFHGMGPTSLSVPEHELHTVATLDTSFTNLVIYWLKGVAQVFLTDSWVTGIFFLAALAINSIWAAVWAAVGSALALLIAIVFHADPGSISAGLFGFSPVLTAIALGNTFYKPTINSSIWCIVGIIVTVFIQAAMDCFMLPFGIPTLTAPFCVATWLFLLPRYKMGDGDTMDRSNWIGKKIVDDIINVNDTIKNDDKELKK